MAKFIQLTESLFSKIVGRLGESHSLVKSAKKAQQGASQAYRGSTGKNLPQGRMLVPKPVFDKMLAESRLKPKSQEPQFMVETGREFETPNDRSRGRKNRGIKSESAQINDMWNQIGNRGRMRERNAELNRAVPGGAQYVLNRRKAFAEYSRAKKEGRRYDWPSNAGPYPGERTNQYYKA
jgi:hypothetical protein